MSPSLFEWSVSQFIAQHQLLDKAKPYLVALSGGADSVALLLALCHLGYRAEACHCNFRLRGNESDRDEQFCVALCQRLSVPLHRIHFDTTQYASLHKVSIEMAARELRYRYFEQLLTDTDAQGICVAHHRDDSVETFLINLIRGTGINGLTGIAPRHDHVIRPLLNVSRQDILDYLAQQQQDYVTDSTNLVPDVVRNKIRLQVLPLLRTINPSVSDSIATTAQHLSEANKMLEAIIDNSQLIVTDSQGVTYIKKELLLAQASPEFVLHTLLAPFHFSGTSIAEILSSIDAVGKRWQSSTHQLVIDRENILTRSLDASSRVAPTIKIPEAGKYNIQREDSFIKVDTYERTPDFQPSRKPMIVTLDADKVDFPLTLRSPRTGDRFHPFGMKGSKLISDFLTDAKCSAFDKDDQLLIEDAHQHIVWLVGHRTSDDSRIDNHTTRILQIEYLS